MWIRFQEKWEWKAGSIKGKMGILEQEGLNGWRWKGGIERDYEKK